MFPFLGMRSSIKNVSKINQALEKMNKKTLTIEDILDEEDLVNELRSLTFTQLMNL